MLSMFERDKDLCICHLTNEQKFLSVLHKMDLCTLQVTQNKNTSSRQMK